MGLLQEISWLRQTQNQSIISRSSAEFSMRGLDQRRRPWNSPLNPTSRNQPIQTHDRHDLGPSADRRGLLGQGRLPPNRSIAQQPLDLSAGVFQKADPVCPVSDAIRLGAPLIHGIILYIRRDNADGAIADLTAALALKNCEGSRPDQPEASPTKKKSDLDQSIKGFYRRHQVPAAGMSCR